MNKLSILLLIFQISISASVDASICSQVFAAHPGKPGGVIWNRAMIRQVGAARMLRRVGVFESSQPKTRGLKIAIDYTRAAVRTPGQPSAILLHGVLDTRADLDGITEQLEKRGWDVLRVDLLGHGATLELNKDIVDANRPIEFETQISMLVELTQYIHSSFDLDRPIIIGHSMGGGLAMNLAKQLRAVGIIPRASVPVTPLIASIDKYLREHGLAPNVLRYYNDRLKEKYGIRTTSDIYRNSAYVQMWRTFFRVLVEPALLVSRSPQMDQFVAVMNSINDPLLKVFMEKNFREYQETKNVERPSSAQLSDEEIDLLVQGGIAATLGVRDVDFGDHMNPTGFDPQTPTLVVSADQDRVVIPPQIADFKAYATAKGYDVTFIEMKGDHLLPRKHPVELTDLIIEFLVSRNLIPAEPRDGKRAR